MTHAVGTVDQKEIRPMLASPIGVAFAPNETAPPISLQKQNVLPFFPTTTLLLLSFLDPFISCSLHYKRLFPSPSPGHLSYFHVSITQTKLNMESSLPCDDMSMQGSQKKEKQTATTRRTLLRKSRTLGSMQNPPCMDMKEEKEDFRLVPW